MMPLSSAELQTKIEKLDQLARQYDFDKRSLDDKHIELNAKQIELEAKYKALEKQVKSIIYDILGKEVKDEIDEFKEQVKKVREGTTADKKAALQACVAITKEIIKVVLNVYTGPIAKLLIGPIASKIYDYMLSDSSLYDEAARDNWASDIMASSIKKLSTDTETPEIRDNKKDYSTQEDDVVQSPIIITHKDVGTIKSNITLPDIEKVRIDIKKSVQKALYHDLAYQFCMSNIGDKIIMSLIKPEQYKFLHKNGVVFDIGIIINLLEKYHIPLIGEMKALTNDKGRINLDVNLKEATEYFSVVKVALSPSHDIELQDLEYLGKNLQKEIGDYNTNERGKKTEEQIKVISKFADAFKTKLEKFGDNKVLCQKVNDFVGKKRWPDTGEPQAIAYLVCSESESTVFDHGNIKNKTFKEIETERVIQFHPEVVSWVLANRKYNKTEKSLDKIIESMAMKLLVAEITFTEVKNNGVDLLIKMQASPAFTNMQNIAVYADRLDSIKSDIYRLVKKLEMSAEVKSWLSKILSRNIKEALEDLKASPSDKGSLKTDQDVLNAVNALKYLRHIVNIKETDFDRVNKREKYISKVTDKPEINSRIKDLLSSEVDLRANVEKTIAEIKPGDHEAFVENYQHELRNSFFL
jgi:hypothetical protein